MRHSCCQSDLSAAWLLERSSRHLTLVSLLMIGVGTHGSTFDGYWVATMEGCVRKNARGFNSSFGGVHWSQGRYRGGES